MAIVRKDPHSWWCHPRRLCESSGPSGECPIGDLLSVQGQRTVWAFFAALPPVSSVKVLAHPLNRTWEDTATSASVKFSGFWEAWEFRRLGFRRRAR